MASRKAARIERTGGLSLSGSSSNPVSHEPCDEDCFTVHTAFWLSLVVNRAGFAGGCFV
jgi:hypothetical protein